MSETPEQKRRKIFLRMFNVKFNSQELYFILQEMGVYPKEVGLSSNVSQYMMLSKLEEYVYGSEAMEVQMAGEKQSPTSSKT